MEMTTQSSPISLPAQRASWLPLPSHLRYAQPPPAAHGEPLTTRDQRPLYLRAIGPDDATALQSCFLRLSPQEIRRRFMHALSELPPTLAQRLCRVDPSLETALVLVDETTTPAQIRGVGRLYVDEATDSAEFSVLVEHAWGRMGLGALLMRRLLDDARRRGLNEIWGHVLQENRPMLELCRELGFQRQRLAQEPGTALMSLKL